MEGDRRLGRSTNTRVHTPLPGQLGRDHKGRCLLPQLILLTDPWFSLFNTEAICGSIYVNEPVWKHYCFNNWITCRHFRWKTTVFQKHTRALAGNCSWLWWLRNDFSVTIEAKFPKPSVPRSCPKPSSSQWTATRARTLVSCCFMLFRQHRAWGPFWFSIT